VLFQDNAGGDKIVIDTTVHACIKQATMATPTFCKTSPSLFIV
jgi:hypothetical protein